MEGKKTNKCHGFVLFVCVLVSLSMTIMGLFYLLGADTRGIGQLYSMKHLPLGKACRMCEKGGCANDTMEIDVESLIKN